jgi:hypothetical protein
MKIWTTIKKSWHEFWHNPVCGCILFSALGGMFLSNCIHGVMLPLQHHSYYGWMDKFNELQLATGYRLGWSVLAIFCFVLAVMLVRNYHIKSTEIAK